MIACRLSFGLAALALLLALRPAPAEIIRDPKEPFRWNELLACELVVVAKYRSHKVPAGPSGRGRRGGPAKSPEEVPTTSTVWPNHRSRPTSTARSTC